MHLYRLSLVGWHNLFRGRCLKHIKKQTAALICECEICCSWAVGSADCPEVMILNPTNSLSQMVQQRGKWGFWNAERKSRPCNCWSWQSCQDGWTVHLTYAATQYFPASQRPPWVSYICQMLCCSFSTTNMGDCVKKNTIRTPPQRCCRFIQNCPMGEMWKHFKYTQRPRSHLPHLSQLA